MSKKKGNSYRKRLAKIIAIYDEYAPKGVTNIFIYNNYIFPEFGICESSFYNYLKNAGRLDENNDEFKDPNQIKMFDEL